MLELDLSPALVNATAMAHISRDAAEALQTMEVRHSYFGEVHVGAPDAVEGERLRGALPKLLQSAREETLKAYLAATPRRLDDARKVFLDPLYTLFSNLRVDDVVMVLDLSVVTVPEWHDATVARLYDSALARIARIQPQLLAISQNTAETYYANYGYTRRPVTVIPLYVPDHLIRHAEGSPNGRPRPYFLFVGSLEVRKNVAGAIAAFKLSRLADEGYQFIVAGGRGHGAEIAERAANGTPGVVLAGRVSNHELQALYASATGFIYPSYLEGFGVPLLEAFQYGLPAVASVTGACQEVGGDLAAYCDPDDHAGIAEQILRIARMSKGERAAFAARAKHRATEHFSKARFQAEFRKAVAGEPLAHGAVDVGI